MLVEVAGVAGASVALLAGACCRGATGILPSNSLESALTPVLLSNKVLATKISTANAPANIVIQIFTMHRGDLGKYTYNLLENITAVSNLIANPNNFNNKLFGFVDLTVQAIGKS